MTKLPLRPTTTAVIVINQKKNETPKIDFHQASHSKYPSIVIHHAVKKTPPDTLASFTSISHQRM